MAVVGLGYWGPNLLRVLADDAGVAVKWICDCDRERLARFHRRYPATWPTTRFDDVLDDPGVDAVVIATPIFTHFDLASASLAAGQAHVRREAARFVVPSSRTSSSRSRTAPTACSCAGRPSCTARRSAP